MREISAQQRRQRMRAENPWWTGGKIRADYRKLNPRAYFERFAGLVEETGVNRAVVLMGPRRVGKTVLLHHVIQRLLGGDQYKARDIGYISLDHPLYTRLSIEEAADEIGRSSGNPNGPRMLILDEIQYLADWERHLKVFVDAHPGVKCVVSGSAAAALRLKSAESGAGRFTDFLLPPLTFHEFLELQGIESLVEGDPYHGYRTSNVKELNRHFVDYVNFGGYPEAISSPAIRSDPARYIGADIVDKVLLRDLPSLYGIQDVQELNTLFMTLAYNTAGEVSLEAMCQQSGVTKPTLKRYLEYLEAAFLIKVVHRIDHNAHRFKRATRFKVYATTPSLRCALFGPVAEDDEEMGPIAETAVFAQWFHSDLHRQLHYASWRNGKVDIVCLDRRRQKPDWCVEVNWSDRYVQHPEELSRFEDFAHRHTELRPLVTTRTLTGSDVPPSANARLDFKPTSLYCYEVGRAAIRSPSSDAAWIFGG